MNDQTSAEVSAPEPQPVAVSSIAVAMGGYRRSQTLSALAPSLAKAMAAMEVAHKGSDNPHFKSKYANLAACHSAAIGPLTANGLSFPMFPMVDRAKKEVTVTALLLHASGEFLEGRIAMPFAQDSAHAIASAETYGRRYLYCMVGIVASEDDDGNAATGLDKQEDPRGSRQTPPGPPPRQQAQQQAPRQETKPKGQQRAAEPPPAERPKSTPPPLPEDPRQVHVQGADVDKPTEAMRQAQENAKFLAEKEAERAKAEKEARSAEPDVSKTLPIEAPETFVEPDNSPDGPIQAHTMQELGKLLKALSIPQVEATRMAKEVTGLDREQLRGSEAGARRFVTHLKKMAKDEGIVISG